jgi:Mono-functional DNA-alkylating methyl methanesulfonate N-term
VPGDSLKVKAEDLPGPGGVLVCFDNFVMYMHEGHDTVQTLIPRRRDLPPDRNILLLVSATHKMKNQFVVLAQSEYGDLYKVRDPFCSVSLSSLRCLVQSSLGTLSTCCASASPHG